MAGLRIIHVLTHSNVTRGGAIQALLLSHGQLDCGHQVRVIANAPSSNPLDPTFDYWKRDGLDVRQFNMGIHGYEHPAENWRFRRMLAEWKPDVVHVHRDVALIFTWLATLGAEPPALISQRGTTHVFRSRLIKRAHCSPRTHRIVAVAHAVKDALTRYGVEPRKIDVVYGSFDVARFDPARANGKRIRDELGLGPDDKLIVQVGELHRKKAPEMLVAAAAQVVREIPNCTFAFVGKGTREAKVRRRMAQYGVESKVKLLGFRQDVGDIYAAADVAVNSSVHDEGLTGAVREALAMGVPTVATRTDGNPEIVRDGETGILVEKKDPDALARGILTLLRNRDAAREMGQKGRKLVLELMRPEVRIARMEQVYRQVLERTQKKASEASSARG